MYATQSVTRQLGLESLDQERKTKKQYNNILANIQHYIPAYIISHFGRVYVYALYLRYGRKNSCAAISTLNKYRFKLVNTIDLSYTIKLILSHFS